MAYFFYYQESLQQLIETTSRISNAEELGYIQIRRRDYVELIDYPSYRVVPDTDGYPIIAPERPSPLYTWNKKFQKWELTEENKQKALLQLRVDKLVDLEAKGKELLNEVYNCPLEEFVAKKCLADQLTTLLASPLATQKKKTKKGSEEAETTSLSADFPFPDALFGMARANKKDPLEFANELIKEVRDTEDNLNKILFFLEKERTLISELNYEDLTSYNLDFENIHLAEISEILTEWKSIKD